MRKSDNSHAKVICSTLQLVTLAVPVYLQYGGSNNNKEQCSSVLQE